MAVDLDAVRLILAETAAEEVLPRFRALQAHEVREKTGGEIVTVADIAAERRMAPRLTDLLPGSHVVGEEGEKFITDSLVFAGYLIAGSYVPETLPACGPGEP